MRNKAILFFCVLLTGFFYTGALLAGNEKSTIKILNSDTAKQHQKFNKTNPKNKANQKQTDAKDIKKRKIVPQKNGEKDLKNDNDVIEFVGYVDYVNEDKTCADKIKKIYEGSKLYFKPEMKSALKDNDDYLSAISNASSGYLPFYFKAKTSGTKKKLIIINFNDNQKDVRTDDRSKYYTTQSAEIKILNKLYSGTRINLYNENLNLLTALKKARKDSQEVDVDIIKHLKWYEEPGNEPIEADNFLVPNTSEIILTPVLCEETYESVILKITGITDLIITPAFITDENETAEVNASAKYEDGSQTGSIEVLIAGDDNLVGSRKILLNDLSLTIAEIKRKMTSKGNVIIKMRVALSNDESVSGEVIIDIKSPQKVESGKTEVTDNNESDSTAEASLAPPNTELADANAAALMQSTVEIKVLETGKNLRLNSNIDTINLTETSTVDVNELDLTNASKPVTPQNDNQPLSPENESAIIEEGDPAIEESHPLIEELTIDSGPKNGTVVFRLLSIDNFDEIKRKVDAIDDYEKAIEKLEKLERSDKSYKESKQFNYIMAYLNYLKAHNPKKAIYYAGRARRLDNEKTREINKLYFIIQWLEKK